MAPVLVSPARRLLQSCCAVFFCFTCAGVIFGFAALKPALIRYGVYHNLCEGQNDEDPMLPCTEQDLRLNYMFTLGTVVTNAFALPVGILLDYAGPRYTSLLGAFIFALGNFSFGLQIVTPYIDTYFIGYILLAIGGPLIFLSSFHLSNVFPAHSGLLLSFITGAFDCSSFPYLLYNTLDQWRGIPIRVFFWGYLIIPLLLVIEQLTIAPASSYKLGDFDQIVPPSIVVTSSEVEDDDGNSSLTARPGYTRENSTTSGFVDGVSVNSSGGRTIRPGDFQKVEDPLLGAMFGKNLERQLKSSYFWIILVFLCIYMCRINYYIQTVFQQLLFYLSDPFLADRISTAFTVLLPLGGVVGIPIIGWLLDKKGTGFAALVILVSGIAYGILGILPYTSTQITAIAIFVILRPLMYTFLGDYAGKAFGFETFGTVYGLINCTAGIFGLVLRPIDVFTKGPLHGNYTPVNVAGIVAGALGAAAVAWRIYGRSGRIALT